MRNQEGYSIAQNKDALVFAGLGGALLSAVVAGVTYFWSKKQSKHEKEEAYRAGCVAQQERDNQQLSRMNAVPYTYIHFCLIGMAVYDRHQPGQVPRILNKYVSRIRKSDHQEERNFYDAQRSKDLTLSERLREYSKFLQQLELADRSWSISQMDVFLRQLAREIGCEVESEWQSFFNYNKQA